VPNVGAPNFFKHTLLDLKTQVDPDKVVEGDLNTPLSPTGMSSKKKKIYKETIDLSDTIYQMDLIDLYRVTIPFFNSTIYILLSRVWNFLQNRTYFRLQSKF
jgi:hypothetical protein